MGWMMGFIWCMYVQAHMIHMLIVPMSTETIPTLSQEEILAVGRDSCGWTLHADVDVEYYGCDDAKDGEDDAADQKSCCFRHVIDININLSMRIDQLQVLKFRDWCYSVVLVIISN